MKEIWKPIRMKKSLRGKKCPYKHYEVSNLGRVRNSKTGQILKQSIDKRMGYNTVHLRGTRPDGTIGDIQSTVHVLVIDTFKPFRMKDRVLINHIDCDKTNNRLDNLEYVTRSENGKHAFDNGLLNGFVLTKKVYDDDMVHKICQYICDGLSNKEISKKLDVRKDYVCEIRHRRRRQRISCNYNW